MSKPSTTDASKPIAAQCELDHRRFAIDISDITPEGCSVEAEQDWSDDADFLHLTIANRIDVNGRMASHKGRRARIRFFGQLHPHVVAELTGVAA